MGKQLAGYRKHNLLSKSLFLRFLYANRCLRPADWPSARRPPSGCGQHYRNTNAHHRDREIASRIGYMACCPHRKSTYQGAEPAKRASRSRYVRAGNFLRHSQVHRVPYAHTQVHCDKSCNRSPSRRDKRHHGAPTHKKIESVQHGSDRELEQRVGIGENCEEPSQMCVADPI